MGILEFVIDMVWIDIVCVVVVNVVVLVVEVEDDFFCLFIVE